MAGQLLPERLLAERLLGAPLTVGRPMLELPVAELPKVELSTAGLLMEQWPTEEGRKAGSTSARRAWAADALRQPAHTAVRRSWLWRLPVLAVAVLQPVERLASPASSTARASSIPCLGARKECVRMLGISNPARIVAHFDKKLNCDSTCEPRYSAWHVPAQRQAEPWPCRRYLRGLSTCFQPVES